MELWIARDEDGDLFLYNQKPFVMSDLNPMTCFTTSNDEFLNISNELFPEVTFENSPQKVKIELIKD